MTSPVGARRVGRAPTGHRLRSPAERCPSANFGRTSHEEGRAVRVDVGRTNLTNGDGILLAGRTLYVVRNQNNRIVVLRMSRDLRRGTFRRTIRNRRFDVPTTLARIGRRLFAVNARFGTNPTPTTDYWVTRVRR